MENFGPILLLVGNCCLMPLACGWLGYALAKGWIRSPVNFNRDVSSSHDLFED